MADYYPLLSKAVFGLKTSTPETRGAIYERARKALLNQLRNMQPPAPEVAIEREARALDEAIARIELEHAGFHPPSGAETPAGKKALPAADAGEMAAQEAAEEPAQMAAQAPEEPERPAPESSQDTSFAELADESSAARENLRPAAPKPASSRSGGLRRFAILAGALAAVVALVAGAAWKLRDRPEDLAKRAPSSQRADQKAGGKIEQRVGAASPTPQPASPPATAAPPVSPAPPRPAQSVPIAYRAALLIQAPSEPGGVKTYVGSVIWRRDSVNSGPNRQLTPVIRADIDVPDAGLKASMTIEKNDDATLSASHTITIRFDPAANSIVGKIRAINVPEMRRDDAPRGAPLQGMEVDVAPNLFLVGLYSASSTQNVEMIRNMAWFDVPMSLADGRIAKVTFEKGAVGTQIIDDVFDSWRNQTDAPPAKP
ncbi:hypothetical protein [Rhodoblastus sp.]|uniref:hypothetical protein n=1 Tax=Rhodoblastus sp. TaxID=1962975 RepID=UPI002606C906|nr:hypothetical protein [Rhodoblastus sp.]